MVQSRTSMLLGMRYNRNHGQRRIKVLRSGTSDGQKEVSQPSPLQIVGNQRSGGRFGFQARRPNNRNKPGGSGGKIQTGGTRKSGPGNQGRS